MRTKALQGGMISVWLTAVLLASSAFAQAPTAAPADAVETATGLRYRVIKPGPSDARTVAPGFVEFQLSLRTVQGKAPSSDWHDGKHSTSFLRLARTMPGLARAVLTTPIGETRRWWIAAAQLRPGYSGMPDMEHVIDLTVLGNYDPVKAPADVAAPPADAIRSPSGLAYKLLKAGPGGAKPTLSSTVEIHYTGWTTDGQVFDSSVQRDERAVFTLQQLIPGWQEGVPLMSPGDSMRFWIPGALAYDSLPPRPGTPRGMLVFDITLYSFE